MKKTFHLLIFSIGILLSSIGFSAFGEDSELLMSLGDQKTIKTPGIKRVSVGNPEVADVTALESSQQILLTATGVGKTNLIIWSRGNRERTIRIRVTDQEPQKIIKQVRELLSGVEGATAKVVGEKVIIQGYVFSQEDLDKIATIQNLYPQIINFATLSPAILDTITQQINLEFQNTGLKEVKAERVGKQVLLHGHVQNPGDKDKALMIASSYYTNTKSFIKDGVELQKMLLVSIDFIEIDKGALKNIGVNWGDSMTITGNASGTGNFGEGKVPWGGTYGLVGNYSWVLNAVKSNSSSRILAQPKLLCQSGKKAEFLAGGEVGIPLITQDTSSVEYKQFGIIMNISPVIDKYGTITTSIEVENSQITDFVSGIPNFSTSRVNTEIYVKSGETIVLSGLMSNVSAKGVEKLPLLGDIPILGELFKSRNFRNDKSELLIFVTTEVLKSKDEKNKRTIKTMQDKYEEEGEQMKFKIMD